MLLSIQNISILLLTLILLALSTYLFYKAAGNLNPAKGNIICLTYYALMSLSVIGTVFFTLGLRSHHMIRYIRHNDTFIQAWYTTILLMVVFPAIVLLLQKVFHYHPNEVQIYRKKETIIHYPTSEFITVLIAGIVCILAIIYTFYKIGLSKNPILNMIQRADPETLKSLRQYASTNFPGNSYIKNILGLAMSPIISYISYIYARKTKEWKWILLTLILFVFTNFMLFYDLEKMPVLAYWLIFVLLSLYYGDNIKLRYFVYLGFIVIGSIYGMYYFISNISYRSLFSTSDGPISRIFFTTPIAYLLHLEVFQYRHPLLRGQSLTSILGRLAGFDIVRRSGSVVMTAVNFIGIRRGFAGVYSGLFLGEAYANFGVLGLFFAMIHVPFMFFIMNLIFTRLPKNPFTVALFGYYSLNYLLTLHAGYTDYFFSSIRFIVVIIVSMMIIFSKILARFLNEDKEKPLG